MIDLQLSDPIALDATAEPWRAAGYTVEYRRFYPHLTRADLRRYHGILLLGGGEPELSSDALSAGDLALLGEWVGGGGVMVFGYAGDGEGFLDRWVMNRWLASQGAGIVIGDYVLRDSTQRPTGALDPQPYAEPVEGSGLRDPGFASFPFGRNHVLLVNRGEQVLARTTRAAFVHPAGQPVAGRGGAAVTAASRVGVGLVLVASRHALGALGPENRPGDTPLLDADGLARTRAFLVALARWTRRPAEWAHVPPAGRGMPLTLAQAPVPVEPLPPALTPPVAVDTIALPLGHDAKLARVAGAPDWMRQQGMRVLWASLFSTRDGRRAARSTASLDSLVALLDAGGFNLLAGDAGPESTDSLHTYWEERLAVRRVWADAVKRLQPTSVAWIPVLDLDKARHAAADSSRGARGEPLAPPCALDSMLWTDGLATAYAALGRLAAEQRTLVIALGLDVGERAYSMGQEFCDAAWRRGLAGLTRTGAGGGRLDSLPYPARYPALRDAGLLPLYYRALEDEVAARASVLRDRVLKQRRDLYFAFRLAQPPADWFTLGLLRGFGLPDRPLLLFTPEVWTRDLLAVQRARGLNMVHAVALAPPSLRARDWSGVRRLVFQESDGFWLTPEEPGGPGASRRMSQDSLGRLLRRLAR